MASSIFRSVPMPLPHLIGWGSSWEIVAAPPSCLLLAFCGVSLYGGAGIDLLKVFTVEKQSSTPTWARP